MPESHLEDLIGRLRRGGLDPTAEEVADALWLSRWLDPAPSRAEPDRRPADPSTPPEHGTGQAIRAPADHTPAPAHGREPGTDHSPGAVPLHTAGGTARPRVDGARQVFPVRAPAATALPGLLGLEQALRAMGRYRGTAAPLPDGAIDEEATAEHAAAGGVVVPVRHPGRRRRCDIQLLMDTGPAMAVWGQLVEELRQACQQSGAFGSVRVHHLYAGDGGMPLIGTTAGPGRHTRLRSADEFHDPTGRWLTLVISDCVGPLWQNGSAQRLLHGWPRTSPMAVVQPLPPRLWGRTALPAEPGLLVRQAETGGRTTFLPDEDPWDEPVAGARPVPVLQPTPEAFEAFSRLLSGTGPTRERAWAAWTTPAPAPAESVPASAPAPRGDDELLRAFRASASPGAVRLAVYLAAAPLTLPVMQLVQRAMLPDTGPMELAEVLLGGLLRQLPGTERQPCFVYPGRVQDLLLSSLDQDTAGLVLKHCSAYVERHFGKGTRNFAAFAAARLADHDTTLTPTGVTDGEGQQDDRGDVESELFARIPARVLRFYLPDLETPVPLAEAERLLGQWQALADPTVLRRAKEHAEAAVRQGDPGLPDAVRAHVLLGRVLRAEAGTAAARTGDRRVELLDAAVTEFGRAHRAARPGSSERSEAALELAATRHELGRLTADPAQLSAALDVLSDTDDLWPAPQRRSRLLRRGRLLLDLDRPREAAAELREGCALLDSEGAPDAVRGPALLDLARALHASGDDGAEAHDALVHAERAAGEDPALRLPCLTARAAFHDTAGDHPAADEAYETAAMLAPPDSTQRCELLTAWGESLLRRASRPEGAAIVDRAENVLREALKALPARSPERGRLQGLVGSALAQRFRHLGFLPDLYESRHLLGQAVRASAEDAVRAEVWLQTGRVRLELWHRAGAPVLADALQAYEAAEREARSAHGDDPGSVTAARALHGRAAVLALMGQPGAARTAYRVARDQWQRLVGVLAEVDWGDVESTRRAAEELDARPAPPIGRRPLPDEEWSRASPPWCPWSG